jgi:hypothetical protein
MSTPQVPKWKTMTLLEDQGQIMARLEGAFMPPARRDRPAAAV